MATNNQVLLNEIIGHEFSETAQYKKEDDFFEFFAAQRVLRSYDLSDEEIEQSLTGGGSDGGCDGIYFFVNGELYQEDLDINQYQNDIRLTLCIIQAKNEESFREVAIEKWKTTLPNLLALDCDCQQYSDRYSKKVIRAFETFKSVYISLIHKRIKLFIDLKYVTKGVELHPNVQKQAEELKELLRSMFRNPTTQVELSFVGADRLMEIVDAPDYTSFFLKLAETPINITDQIYVALVNLTDYYRFITNKENELIKQIFESNIRDYQGKVTVNKEIRSTLEQRTEEDFWWLNNGVTILANSAVYNTLKELRIEHPEIVNGLQTSNEIYNFFSQNQSAFQDESRKILVRVIVPRSEDSRDKIIFATNSQTAIPKSSLRTTDSIHRQIELYFKSRQLYYDRRKNYYKNQGKKSAQIVSVSFLAQCLMSIVLRKPDYARARPSTLLMDEDAYKKLYMKKQTLQTFYVAASIGKKVDWALKACADFSPNEKNDILFYTIYVVAAYYTGKSEIKPVDLDTVDLAKIDDTTIIECAHKVYDIYCYLGCTDKVAKGSEMIPYIVKLASEL